jgi:putative transposase
VAMAIPSLSMKFSSRLMENNIICGEQLTRKAYPKPSECCGYGEVADVYLQIWRDSAAAKRFFKRLLKTHRGEARKIVTDKLRSYGVAHQELIPDSIHDTSQYANNRAELSHQPTRVRERGMRRLKSIVQAERFLGVHSVVYNLFSPGRHLTSASHYRLFRMRAFASWKSAMV